MSCNRNRSEPVALDARGFQYPKRGGGQGEMTTLYRGTSSCGWEAPRAGTQNQALAWARSHANGVHTGIVSCADGKHEPKPDDYCRRCDADCLSPAERTEMLAAIWGGVVPNAV